VDAYDADVLVYAATDHPLGRVVRTLLKSNDEAVGSVLLLPEVLTKPIRASATRELEELLDMLARLTLLPCDHATAELSSALGAAHKLKAADAVHLATAVRAGADRFVTNNKKDFPQTIEEIEIVYPDQL
jgi:predicted nucleic acid-binding protein